MPKVSVPPAAARQAGIAADGARTNLIMSLADGSLACRWSFGATYTADDSQRFAEGIPITLAGTAAQQAVSFYGGTQGSVVDVTTL